MDLERLWLTPDFTFSYKDKYYQESGTDTNKIVFVILELIRCYG